MASDWSRSAPGVWLVSSMMRVDQGEAPVTILHPAIRRGSSWEEKKTNSFVTVFGWMALVWEDFTGCHSSLQRHDKHHFNLFYPTFCFFFLSKILLLLQWKNISDFPRKWGELEIHGVVSPCIGQYFGCHSTLLLADYWNLRHLLCPSSWLISTIYPV